MLATRFDGSSGWEFAGTFAISDFTDFARRSSAGLIRRNSLPVVADGRMAGEHPHLVPCVTVLARLADVADVAAGPTPRRVLDVPDTVRAEASS